MAYDVLAEMEGLKGLKWKRVERIHKIYALAPRMRPT